MIFSLNKFRLYFNFFDENLIFHGEPGDDEHVPVLRQLMGETSIQKSKLIKKK